MASEPVVYVVDGDAAAAQALTRLLHTDHLAVQSFRSAEAFLRAHDPDAPGCAVLDAGLPGLDGRWLQGLGRVVVFVAGHAEVGQGVRAMKAGAVDFLMKPVDAADFVAAVRHALVRDAHERAVRLELQRIRARVATLTPRERQVLRQVVAGRLNKQIASDLGIAEKTIKVHRARAMEKMAAGSLAQLVREVVALEVGAVTYAEADLSRRPREGSDLY